MYPESRPGEFYLVDTECINGGVPYSDNFYIVNRYCISRVSATSSRLVITSEIKYRKTVWGFVRSFLDKNVTAGILDAFGSLGESSDSRWEWRDDGVENSNETCTQGS